MKTLLVLSVLSLLAFAGCVTEEYEEKITHGEVSEESLEESNKETQGKLMNTAYTKENIDDKAALDKQRIETTEVVDVTTVDEAKAALASDAERISISKEVWRQLVDDETYNIIAEEGTERPFTSPLNDNKEEGIYVTAGCKQPVFSSDAKYDSGTGWPSFWEPIDDDAVELRADYRLVYKRWEVVGSRCGEHLGHVFTDGPSPTGLRYCMNGDALEFIPKAEANSLEEI